MGKIRWMSVFAVLFAVSCTVSAWSGAGLSWVLAAGFSGVIAALLAGQDG